MKIRFHHFLLKHHQTYIHIPFLICSSVFLSGCGGSGGSGRDEADVSAGQVQPIEFQQPLSNIESASLRDTNGTEEQLSGTLKLTYSDATVSNENQANMLNLYWTDGDGSVSSQQPFTQLPLNSDKTEVTLNNVSIPNHAYGILIFSSNDAGESEEGFPVSFHDFQGNTNLSGPGGNEQTFWYYGNDRPHISILRDASQSICWFDNGLVSVIDMNNTRDESNHDGINQSNTPDDATYPPYSFNCDAEPVNSYRTISDNIGVWTYSTINDAMHYGTHVYDIFLKYLNEPPLKEKIRLRVHYDNEVSVSAFWDGAYANFSDGYGSHYSLATLDIIAHEVAHGVLDRISSLKIFDGPITQDMRTLHEAFSDISGVIAKYEYTGTLSSWVHGEESNGRIRNLDQIITEPGAIASFLDYNEANNNPYFRIGIMTYPFYQLTQTWGVEQAYNIYINAAKYCWQPTSTLPEAAECIKEQASNQELPEQDVIDAFKTVKIKLFDEGVLSHFTLVKNDLTVTLSDNSQSTSSVSNWQWDFGDNTQSNDTHPIHTYTQPGEYIIRLVVRDQSGSEDSFERKITI
ncbi:PKD domain-containing protein [Litoribrevibacter euphylliae]|uniref:PKD domain-containing protein n=1 Tax=Litoribrevibacter euphylliae TaxID=1834034 RepID=A0ABV7H8Y1_9GAMM